LPDVGSQIIPLGLISTQPGLVSRTGICPFMSDTRANTTDVIRRKVFDAKPRCMIIIVFFD
jgi:hypothetical protein